MTLKELYDSIGGDYNQALRVLRVEKLINKHILRLADSGVVQKLIDAGKTMDPTQLFETAHAVKGVCSNLGLTQFAEAASEISEEYRPGNSRKLTDDEVRAKLQDISDLYERTTDGIRRYKESQG